MLKKVLPILLTFTVVLVFLSWMILESDLNLSENDALEVELGDKLQKGKGGGLPKITREGEATLSHLNLQEGQNQLPNTTPRDLSLEASISKQIMLTSSVHHLNDSTLSSTQVMEALSEKSADDLKKQFLQNLADSNSPASTDKKPSPKRFSLSGIVSGAKAFESDLIFTKLGNSSASSKTSLDKNGQYKINLEAGKYKITLSTSAYGISPENFSFYTNASNKNFTLIKKIKVEGSFISYATRKPIVGLEVELRKGTDLSSGESNSGGTVEFALNGPGQYSLRLLKTGPYQIVGKNYFNFSRQEDSFLAEVSLVEKKIIFVVNEKGKPIAEARGELFTELGVNTQKKLFRADPQGKIILGMIKGQKSSLFISEKGYSSKLLDTQDLTSSSGNIHVSLQKSQVREFKVIDQEGLPIEGIRIRIRLSFFGGSITVGRGRSDSSGLVRISELSDNTAYRIYMNIDSTKPYLVPQNGQKYLSSDELYLLKLTRLKTQRIQGSVSRPDGKPYQGRVILQTLIERDRLYGKSDSDGNFDLIKKFEGDYSLEIPWSGGTFKKAYPSHENNLNILLEQNDQVRTEGVAKVIDSETEEVIVDARILDSLAKDGVFRFSMREYAIDVKAPGYVFRKIYKADYPKEGELIIKLSKITLTELEFVDVQNQPVPWVKVLVVSGSWTTPPSDSSFDRHHPQVSDVEGKLTLKNLSLKDNAICAKAEGMLPLWIKDLRPKEYRKFTFKKGESLSLKFSKDGENILEFYASLAGLTTRSIYKKQKTTTGELVFAGIPKGLYRGRIYLHSFRNDSSGTVFDVYVEAGQDNKKTVQFEEGTASLKVKVPQSSELSRVILSLSRKKRNYSSNSPTEELTLFENLPEGVFQLFASFLYKGKRSYKTFGSVFLEKGEAKEVTFQLFESAGASLTLLFGDSVTRGELSIQSRANRYYYKKIIEAEKEVALKNLSPGVYRIKFLREGQKLNKDITLKEGGASSLDLSILEKNGASLEILPRGEIPENFILSYSLVIQIPGGLIYRKNDIIGEGGVRLNQLPEGMAIVKALLSQGTTKGSTIQGHRIRLKEGDDEDVEIDLGLNIDKGSLEVKLNDKIYDGTFLLSSPQSNWQYSGKFSGESFSLASLYPGLYSLKLKAYDSQRKPMDKMIFEIKISSGETKILTPSYPEDSTLGSISIRISEWEIGDWIFLPGKSSNPKREKDFFIYKNLSPRDYTLRLRWGAYNQLSPLFFLSEGENKKIEMVKNKGSARIVGSLIQGNTPLNGVTVTLQGQELSGSLESQEGNFVFAELPSGHYKIQSHLPDFTREVDLSSGETRELKIQLSEKGESSLEAHIEVSGWKATGICWLYSYQEKRIVDEAVFNQGHILFKKLGSGAYKILFQKGGVIHKLNVNIEEGETKVLEENLSEGKATLEIQRKQNSIVKLVMLHPASTTNIPSRIHWAHIINEHEALAYQKKIKSHSKIYFKGLSAQEAILATYVYSTGVYILKEKISISLIDGNSKVSIP